MITMIATNPRHPTIPPTVPPTIAPMLFSPLLPLLAVNPPIQTLFAYKHSIATLQYTVAIVLFFIFNAIMPSLIYSICAFDIPIHRF